MSRWRPLTVWQDTRSVRQICFVTNCDPRWWFQQVIVHLRWTLQIIIVQSYESVSDLRLRSPGFSGFYSLNLLWTREEPQRVIEIKIKEKRWKKKKTQNKTGRKWDSERVGVGDRQTKEGRGWGLTGTCPQTDVKITHRPAGDVSAGEEEADRKSEGRETKACESAVVQTPKKIKNAERDHSLV